LRLPASLRLGVGRPFGAVVSDPRSAPEPDESVAGEASPVSAVSASRGHGVVSSAFLRPSSFTFARLLRGESVSGTSPATMQLADGVGLAEEEKVLLIRVGLFELAAEWVRRAIWDTREKR
jgi:hypothetical protein